MIETKHEEPAPPPMASRPVPAPEPEPEPAAHSNGPSAVAQYDYDAAEGNEISFPDGAIIEDIVSLPEMPGCTHANMLAGVPG